MNKQLHLFIKNKGYTDNEIKRLSKQEIKDFAFEYSYAKRLGMVA